MAVQSVFSAPPAESPQPFRRAISVEKNRAGARRRCSSPPTEHPAFVKKNNMAIRPNKNWIATKVNFQLYARLQPSDQGCRFLSVFAPVLPRSWPTFAFVPNDTIDSLVSQVGNSSQADASGTIFRAERGLSDFACIPTRIFTALDLSSNVQFSSVTPKYPG